MPPSVMDSEQVPSGLLNSAGKGIAGITATATAVFPGRDLGPRTYAILGAPPRRIARSIAY